MLAKRRAERPPTRHATQVPREDPLDRHHFIYLLGQLPDPHLWRQDGQIERPVLLDAGYSGI